MYLDMHGSGSTIWLRASLLPQVEPQNLNYLTPGSNTGHTAMSDNWLGHIVIHVITWQDQPHFQCLFRESLCLKLILTGKNWTHVRKKWAWTEVPLNKKHWFDCTWPATKDGAKPTQVWHGHISPVRGNWMFLVGSWQRNPQDSSSHLKFKPEVVLRK